MPAIDITDTYWIGTKEYDAAVALAALDAEMDGDIALADQIRSDYAEARLLRRI